VPVAVNSAQIQQENPKRVFGKPFTKGVSGNPNGKPKGTRSFQTDFRLALKQINNSKTGKPYKENEFIQSILQNMMTNLDTGDIKYQRLGVDILDRLYGKPTQSLDHTTQGEKINPVPVITGMRIVYDKS
jgi:hypothetical protein